MKLIVKIAFIFQFATIVKCKCDSGFTNETQDIFNELKNTRNVFKNCSIFNETTGKLNELKLRDISKIVNDVNKLLTNLSSYPQLPLTIWTNSLESISSLMVNISDQNVGFVYAGNLTSTSLAVLNRLVESSHIWTFLSMPNRAQAATTIFEIIQELSIVLNKVVSYYYFNYSSIYLVSSTFYCGTNYPCNDIAFNLDTHQLKLPMNSLNITSGRLFGVTAVRVCNLSSYLPYENYQVNSHIASLIVRDQKESVQLNDPYKLQLTLTNINSPSYLGVPQCVFWDISQSTWSSQGCQYSPSNSTDLETICECNHLTSFAVLVPIENQSNQDAILEEVENEIDDILANITSSNVTVDSLKYSISRMTDLIWNVTQDDIIDSINRSTVLRLTDKSLDVFDNLIEQSKIWKNLTPNDRVNSSAQIFSSINDIGVLMNANQNDFDTIFNYTNIILQTKLLTIDDGDITFNFDGVHLQIPFKALNFINFSSNDEFPSRISATASVLKNFLSYLSFGNIIPNSQLLSFTIGRERDSINLIHPYKLKFSMKNVNLTEFGDNVQCSFWNFVKQNWSNKGCQPNQYESNRSFTVCECDHLTNFAAIADISNREIQSLVKSILTYASTLSSLFLICSIYISLKFNRVHYTVQEDQFKTKSNRFALSLSISAWILVTHFLIMFGLDRTEIAVICDLNSIVLLFTLLTTFSFMLMFSIHLYICTSRHHLFRFISFKTFAIIAYTLPSVIMLLSFVLIFSIETSNLADLFNSLSGEYFCWLSSRKYPYHIWIFVCPITVIIFINLCVLFTIFWKVFRNSHDKHSSQTNRDLLFAFILLFKLGIPWIIYVLYINEYMAHIFSYVFILINGTQGIPLFAEQYYIYRAKKTRYSFGMF